MNEESSEKLDFLSIVKRDWKKMLLVALVLNIVIAIGQLIIGFPMIIIAFGLIVHYFDSLLMTLIGWLAYWSLKRIKTNSEMDT